MYKIGIMTKNYQVQCPRVSAQPSTSNSSSSSAQGANTQSTELVSLENFLQSSSLMGSGADLATIIYAMQIQQIDNDVAAGLREIQLVSKAREKIDERMAQLRDLKDRIGGDDKSIKVREGLNDDINVDKTNYKVDVDNNEIIPQSEGTLGKDATFRFDTGQKDALGFKIEVDVPCREITSKEVDAEISRLEGLSHQLDSDREIKMIMLNQKLNKKEQAVTQLTNIIKKTHDTKSAIINNLK